MTDVTTGAGEAYAACKLLFEDLNLLGNDYCKAIRDSDVILPAFEEYSHSPNELFVKKNHVWIAYRTDGEWVTFAAAYVIFEEGKKHFKVGPKLRPEVWYVLGRATLQGNRAKAVRAMFGNDRQSRFQPALALGGTVSLHRYDADGMMWSAVLIGFEIGDIDSPETLEQRVVTPLKAAALERSIPL